MTAAVEALAARLGRAMGARRPAPLRVWCSWYSYYRDVTLDAMLENARLARERGLPFDVFQLDDGFQADLGDWTRPAEHFGGHARDLPGPLRELGFTPGLWLAPFLVGPGSQLFTEHRDWLVRGPDGAPLHDMTRLGEVRTVLRASGDWQRYQAERAMPHYGGVFDWHTLEGPFVLERGGTFHLLYSGGAWIGETYGVGHATAPHPLGPFQEPQPGAAVLRSGRGLIGPGHASVTQRGDQDHLVFHAWDAAHTMRQLHVAPLSWTSGRPVAVVP